MHLSTDARQLIKEVTEALENPVKSLKAADAVLLLPRIRVMLERLLLCVEHLSQSDSQLVFMRNTLDQAVTKIIEETWILNEEVAKVTNSPTAEKVPTKALQKPLIRALAALDQMQQLLKKIEEC